MADLHTLRVIEGADPDGWEHREPTPQDYRAFRRWVVESHGQATYDEYMRGGWEPEPDV